MSNLIYTKSHIGQSIQYTIEFSTASANSPLIKKLKDEVSRITKAANLSYEYEGSWTMMCIDCIEHRTYTLRLPADSKAAKTIQATALWVVRGCFAN